MSRGPGRIERAILAAIEQGKQRGRPVCLSSSQLAVDCYPDTSPAMAQQKAVLRAMHTFVRKWPQYALSGGNGPKPLVLYEPASPLSAVWARLRVERRDAVTLADAQRALTAIREDEPGVVALGVARQHNDFFRFWRVRRHPNGRWLVEALRTGDTEWRSMSSYATQQQAMEMMFTPSAKPLPPGVLPPSGVPSAYVTEEQSDRYWAAKQRREEAEARKQKRVSLLDRFFHYGERPN